MSNKKQAECFQCRDLSKQEHEALQEAGMLQQGEG